MTSEEKQQFDTIQDQLNHAKLSAEESRTYLISMLGRTNDEARMYRGLFWCLLGVGMLALMLRFLHH